VESKALIDSGPKKTSGNAEIRQHFGAKCGTDWSGKRSAVRIENDEDYKRA
jgi:hypothetical protein